MTNDDENDTQCMRFLLIFFFIFVKDIMRKLNINYINSFNYEENQQYVRQHLSKNAIIDIWRPFTAQWRTIAFNVCRIFLAKHWRLQNIFHNLTCVSCILKNLFPIIHSISIIITRLYILHSSCTLHIVSGNVSCCICKVIAKAVDKWQKRFLHRIVDSTITSNLLWLLVILWLKLQQR